MRCKNCKDKFEPYEFNGKFCKEIDCQVAKGMFLLGKQKVAKKKEWTKTKKELRPFTHTKETKGYLQAEINKLSRMIDKKFNHSNCIDCGKYMENVDGGHYTSVGANSTLRYNLHNIHAQDRGCNRNERQGSRNTGYFKGLIERYGLDYANMVDTELQVKYKYLGLKEQEISNKLKLVRSLVRNFETYDLKDAKEARNIFNKIIGIYN